MPIKPEHKMTLDQVRREVEPQGFVFKESLEFLPWQHVIIFEKPVEAKSDTKSDTNRARRRSRSQTQRLVIHSRLNHESRVGFISREIIRIWPRIWSGCIVRSLIRATDLIFGSPHDVQSLTVRDG